MIGTRLKLRLCGILLAALPFASSALANNYELDLSVWISGERQVIDQPLLLDAAGTSLELLDQYRLDLAIEAVNDPLAPDGAVWLTVEIFNWDASTQEWVFFTDTLLGAPMGQKQNLTVSGEDNRSGPKDAALHIEIVVNSDQT